jgi:hypothetical protein
MEAMSTGAFLFLLAALVWRRRRRQADLTRVNIDNIRRQVAHDPARYEFYQG